MAAQDALDPTGMLPRDDATGLPTAIAAEPSQYLASTVVYLVGMITLVAFALTLFAALRERMPNWLRRPPRCSFVEDGEVSPGGAEIWSRIQEGPAFVVLTPLLVMAILGLPGRLRPRLG